jgi:hypothetical protein
MGAAGAIPAILSVAELGVKTYSAVEQANQQKKMADAQAKAFSAPPAMLNQPVPPITQPAPSALPGSNVSPIVQQPHSTVAESPAQGLAALDPNKQKSGMTVGV